MKDLAANGQVPAAQACQSPLFSAMGSWGFSEQDRPVSAPSAVQHNQKAVNHPAVVSLEPKGFCDVTRILWFSQTKMTSARQSLEWEPWARRETRTSPAICLKMFRNCCCSSVSWSVWPGRACGDTRETGSWEPKPQPQTAPQSDSSWPRLMLCLLAEPEGDPLHSLPLALVPQVTGTQAPCPPPTHLQTTFSTVLSLTLPTRSSKPPLSSWPSP